MDRYSGQSHLVNEWNKWSNPVGGGGRQLSSSKSQFTGSGEQAPSRGVCDVYRVKRISMKNSPSKSPPRNLKKIQHKQNVNSSRIAAQQNNRSSRWPGPQNAAFAQKHGKRFNANGESNYKTNRGANAGSTRSTPINDMKATAPSFSSLPAPLKRKVPVTPMNDRCYGTPIPLMSPQGSWVYSDGLLPTPSVPPASFLNVGTMRFPSMEQMAKYPPPAFCNFHPAAASMMPHLPAVQLQIPLHPLQPIWTEYFSPEGAPYYYNSITKVSTWEKPAELAESNRVLINEADKSPKPVTSKPIPNSSWCLVGTGDNRIFYHNPTTRMSVWDMPVELNSREDVYQMITDLRQQFEQTRNAVQVTNMNNCHNDLNNDNNNNVQSQRNDANLETQEPAVNVPSKKKEKREKRRISNDAASEETKTKTDAEKTTDLKAADDNTQNKAVIEEEELSLEKITTLKGIDIAVAERIAGKEREKVPLEIRQERFLELLTDKKVSALSTWERELQKIVFEPRYLLLTSKERKAAFETFVTTKAAEEAKESSARYGMVREEYIKFVEGVLNKHKPNYSYDQFERKYAKDPKLNLIDKPKVRKLLFEECQVEFRKQAKNQENRNELTNHDEPEEAVYSKDMGGTHSLKQARKDFKDFLANTIYENYQNSWKYTLKKFGLRHDRRFTKLETNEMKEIFQKHCRKLQRDVKVIYDDEENDADAKNKKSRLERDHHYDSYLTPHETTNSTWSNYNWFDHYIETDEEFSS